FPPAAIREFCNRAGIAKRDNLIGIELLEFCVREELNRTTNRVMAVLDPVKLVITNYPEGQVEYLETENNPEDENAGMRSLPFSRELYIERDDFMEDPPKKYFRLAPGQDVRLKSAYILHCEKAVKDPATGEITAIHCTYYPDSRSGADTSGVKAKGTIHWVSVAHAKKAEVRMYDRLFTDPEPASHEDKDFLEFFNPESLNVITAYVEPSLADAQGGQQFQFIRKGYFCADPDTSAEKPVFNLTVGLKDSFAKKLG
ncbi:MAG TPA: glutamine--tRNA ligase, partial [Flavilitoribacter sp.]|nr:glutamine--tRNA ligase [Flavilitoribacter sp.]